jgi:2-polyprenyl-3-methyl-5-hydroxy-6-metoxy-1,4-benzoquinol methylase
MGVTNERVEFILSRVTGTDVLDVGCARTAMPRAAEEEGHCLHFQLCRHLRGTRVLGLDVDRAAVEELRNQGLEILVGDAQDMHLDAHFDTIVGGELIEHLANPGGFLLGCRRHLKLGGKVILSTPNPFSLMYYLMFLKNFTHAFNPEHALWLCPQTLKQLAERCGFRVAEMMFADDLRPEVIPSLWYRVFVGVYRVCRPFLPKRTRNTIVAVLAPA